MSVDRYVIFCVVGYSRNSRMVLITNNQLLIIE